MYRAKRLRQEPLSELLCPACGKHFLYQKSMERHIKTEHCQEGKKFSCDICEKEFDYHDNLTRHVKEGHGGAAKHKCHLCPAAYTREAKLEEHYKYDKHFYEFECGLCKKNLVFKKWEGLIAHVEVRGSEMRKRRVGVGLSLTCTSQESVMEMVEGTRLTKITYEEMFEADKIAWKEKEKCINAGLSAAYDGAKQTPHVDVEFVKNKDHVIPHRGAWWCNVCDEKQPFSDEYCKFKCTKTWGLKWSDT